jgi:hypothetical protein
VSRVQLPSQTLWLHNNRKIVLRNLGSDTYSLTTPKGLNVAASVRFAPILLQKSACDGRSAISLKSD